MALASCTSSSFQAKPILSVWRRVLAASGFTFQSILLQEIPRNAPGFLYLRLAWVWDFAGVKAAIGASSGIGGAVSSLGRHGVLLEGEFLFQVLGADGVILAGQAYGEYSGVDWRMLGCSGIERDRACAKCVFDYEEEEEETINEGAEA